MADHEAPLRESLQDGCDETDLQRVWRKLQHTPIRRKNRHRSRWAIAMAACFALLVFGWAMTRTPYTPAGPLARADGATVTSLAVAPDDRPTSVPMADGSKIELRPDTKLEVIENDGHAFKTVLRRGVGTFDVHPGGPRKWTVESGGIAVEVVGTRFTLARDVGSLRVDVQHGVVVVRGARVPDRILRLEAGQHARFTTDDSHLAPTASAPLAASCAPSESAAPDQNAPPASASVAPPVGPASAGVRNDGVDDWLHEADTARLNGDRARAKRLLELVVQSTPKGDPRRALAAFSLAQLEMADRPHAAAESLSGALDAGVPIGMQEDAWARLVQAYARSGDYANAKQAAREYEKRFPNGSRLAEVRRWAEGRD